MRRALLAILPLLLLLIQIGVVHERLVSEHRVRPIHVPDTQSYINHAQLATIDGALMHYRSLGYPTAIRLFGLDRLPGLELWLFFAGVVAFYCAVAGYTGRSWIALAAASPLLYGQTLELLGRLQPDFAACGLVLLAVSWLLLLAGRPRNPLLWMALTASVFAAYQMRPASLFLLGWLPVIGWLLAIVRRRRATRPALAFAASILAATWIPFLAFAGWRHSRVGDFGLVGFGGYNLSGLAAALVDEPILDELDGAHRRMARQMYKMRRRRGWEPYRPGEGSAEWFEQYNENLWRIGVQSAKQQIVLEEGGLKVDHEPHRSLHLRINDRLRDVSREIIKRRPGHYLTWVKDANLYGWKQLPESPWVLWPALLLGLSAGGLAVARRAGLVARRDGGAVPEALALLALGVTYFAAYVLLISLVSFPFSRYYYGTVLFLPSGLCAALAAVWLAALPARQRSMTADTSGESRGGGER